MPCPAGRRPHPRPSTDPGRHPLLLSTREACAHATPAKRNSNYTVPAARPRPPDAFYASKTRRKDEAYTAKEGHPAAQILIQQGRQRESAPPAHLNQVAEALRAPERRLLRLFHKKTRFRASTAAEFLQERSQRRAPRRRDPRRRDPPSRDPPSRDPPSRDLPSRTTLRGRAAKAAG
ncbi:hypothetical protein DFH06DRAFT_1144130 [Mycena polygramma]|nr:hypothetical protein DFH06DRAFT_1144130 [Mycena polygramma]